MRGIVPVVVAAALAFSAGVSAATSPAWPELAFVVDDGMLIHALCSRGPMTSAGPPLVQAVVDVQNRMWTESTTHYDLMRGRWEPALLSPAGVSSISTGL